MDEAKDFISSLPQAAAYKIYYNMKRIASGERNSELFKKLEGAEIWEFRTLYSRYRKEDTEDTFERNSEG